MLEIQLDERVQRPLGVDDEPSVLERLDGVLVGEPASDLVDEAKADPQTQLEEEVGPASRKANPVAHAGRIPVGGVWLSPIFAVGSALSPDIRHLHPGRPAVSAVRSSE